METLFWISGAVLALLWSWRSIDTALGLPRIADITRPEWDLRDPGAPRLTVIVPARNEARDIEACLASLLALDYPDFEVIAINDRSTDATGAIMDRLAGGFPRLRVIHVRDLPPGWMGKTHAMWLGGREATGELLLFTDGDTFFRPDSVRRAVAYLRRRELDHLVLFPTMLFKYAGEKMIVSFFHAALSFAHRPWKVSDPKAYDHVGVGAFNLVRRAAYEAIGTYGAMRLEVIDDLRLGKLIKDHGFRQDVVFGLHLVSIHWATGALGVVRTLSKNTFAILRFSWTLVIAGSLGIAFLCLGPLSGLLFAPAWTKLPFAIALAAMASLYIQSVPVTTISPWYFFAHPLGACLSLYAIWRSAWQTSRRGVVWRGTAYSLDMFRKAAGKD